MPLSEPMEACADPARTDGAAPISGPSAPSSLRLFDPAWRPSRPERLPDGRGWPSVRIVVLAGPDRGDVAATLDALDAQDYPEADAIAVGNAAVSGVAQGASADFLLMLAAGERLVPGALVSLVTEAVLTGADSVTGLRILTDGERVLRLDICTGEAALLSRAAVRRAGGIDPTAIDPRADLRARLAAAGASGSRIGRPVLIGPDDASPPPPTTTLTIASLTDAGHRGGAGIAHRRLTEALALAGHRVTHLRLGDEAPSAEAEWTDRFPKAEGALREGYDLVLAGNLHGATRSTAILGRILRDVPVALVLHDLFPLTGRCAHPKSCAVIATGCDARCPTPDEFPQLAPGRIATTFAEKRAVLAEGRPLLLANSDWTAACARDLSPTRTSIAQIRLAFPTGVFRPGDRSALRRRLGLPAHDVLIVFSAVIADAPDKGFSDLVATIRAVARPGVGFVALGRLDDPAAFGVDNLHAPGPVGDEDSLAEWYAACDIGLTASRLETLGQTPIEAGLCGVPTVAYRATGLTSAIVDGVTGLLVEPGGSLAVALETLIADEARRRVLGAFARIVLENRFSHAACALSLHDAFAEWDRLPSVAAAERLCFAPEMLGHFAFAAERCPGATGTVAARSRPIMRLARRAKHAILGRGTPLWLRRALYAASRLRRALAQTGAPRR